ncbi:ASCH domain-containing protein [Nocardioides sp. CER19]|uniref:ASCH domain-containing protein n=1 Tax=Nocardioides sp. CER19 TaxID=3038538 RepID=UPI00244C0F4B|nr:ASCH domain-containing protein [Nocardioides sp. CER19]MDH2416316.1 ASCH domain-containing protein [Nocardioides sp. CER19]
MTFDDLADLPVLELAAPGALREEGIQAIRCGEKTALTGLLEIYAHAGEPLPQPGTRLCVVDSAGRPAAVIELTDVQKLRICEVDDEYAHAEGRGYTNASDWRRAHEEFFRSDYVADYLGHVPSIGDDTIVVLQRFKLIASNAHDPADHGAAERPTSGAR